MFHSTTHSLVLHDTMKMAKWQATSEWGAKRGPDPILQFYDFANGVLAAVARKAPAVPICQFLLDQAYFNGIGNYLRAEILVRAGLDPFQEASNVFKNSPKSFTQSVLNSILEETTAPLEAQKAMHATKKFDPGVLVLYLARQIQLEVLANGGMNKYGNADEQARFKAWLRVYGKGKEVKVGGRSVHCTQEQRLGKQERDLGVFINAYPYELPPLYYKSPTIILTSDVAAASSSSSASKSSPAGAPGLTSGAASYSSYSASPTPASSGGQFAAPRIEEVILPCDKIIDLHVPVLSKLLLAVTSLSRNGKLSFTDQPGVRELVIRGHPIVYAAWQAFETDLDVNEFADTLIRLARKTEAVRAREERLYHIIEAAKMEQLRQDPRVVQMLQQSVSNLQIEDPRKKEKRRPFDTNSQSNSSSSSSASTSVAGSDDEMSDSGDDMIRDVTAPSKKKAMAHRGRVISEEQSKKKKSSKFDAPASLIQAKSKKKSKSVFGSLSPPTSPSPSSFSFTSSSAANSATSIDFVNLLGDKSWLKHLSGFLTTNKEMKSLTSFLETAYKTNSPPVYPAVNNIFNAFQLCPLDKVKVVILGQDPYHTPGLAHGLCFSVMEPNAPPPSLVNIYKELSTDISGFKIPTTGNLTPWAEQGVFLLNTVLTVYESKPNSHANMGWEKFTDLVIRTIASQCKGVVFMLWGKPSQKKATIIKEISSQHTILNASHPSPLSAFNGWFGCKHFSKANAVLAASGKTPIDWSLS